MIVNVASEYFTIKTSALTLDLKTWICEHHKNIWQYQDSVLLETSRWDGIMFRLKFSERFVADAD